MKNNKEFDYENNNDIENKNVLKKIKTTEFNFIIDI